MLTSPMNVTIASTNGASLKTQATSTDTGPGHSPVLPANANPAPAAPVIEPELPSNSVLTTVSAGTATVASRTVLQDLALNVAGMLRIPRGSEENMTALFIRIIAAIERMSQGERLQFEVRSGLKALKITLTDLANALKNPDGAEAARLTATAEAPLATPGRTSASSATATYLQEGTANGHAEETLAMRAAARSNAAGLGLFSAETRSRTNQPPADAKGLQNQLKSLFEPGAAERKPGTGNPPATTSGSEETLAQPPAETARTDGTIIRAANLRIDPQTAVKLREIADRIAEIGQGFQETEVETEVANKAEAKANDKAETVDRRLQTMLTLKGLAEVITSLQGKAAELFASAPEALSGNTGTLPNPADIEMPAEGVVSGEMETEVALPDVEQATSETAIESHQTVELSVAEENEAAVPARHKPIASPEADTHAVAADQAAAPKPNTTTQGVPFAHALLQPAREEFLPEVEEIDDRDRSEDEEADDRNDEDGEPRRPRDEYDAMRDPQPEEKPAIVINRDSTEADRAFALYQRMGGF